MSEVRLGIVGLGVMGGTHARNILAGKVERLKLAAVADIDAAKLTAFDGVPGFSSAEAMMDSGLVDAVLVATPHYGHTTIGIQALERGFHLLVEKPISVHKADCERLIAAHTKDSQVFAAMFNQRTDRYYIKLRELIRSGELGRLLRVNWIITSWFRTEYYYAMGGWRATWAGEGGGVLLNQCPHNLDLLCWMFGQPERVRAFCKFGKYHDIEVEDDVTAYLEFPGGATGVFITTTGEAPGTNRLEVVGDRGKLVYENSTLTFYRNEQLTSAFRSETQEAFATPAHWTCQIPAAGHGGQHNEVLGNFVEAILDGKPLTAPAAEGIQSVELANAMLLSSFLGETVEIPLDGAVYEAQLQEKIRTSRFEKKTVAAGASAEDFAKSFR